MRDKNAPIILAAGGTGGHVFPAEALAETLLCRNRKLIWLKDERTKTFYKNLCDLESYTIRLNSNNNSGIIGRSRKFISLVIGICKAWLIINKIRPAVVIGFGSYASASVMVAAILNRVPTAIHEQNTVIGKTNRILARFVNAVCISYNKTLMIPKGVDPFLTGMPVRSDFRFVRDKPYLPPRDNDDIKIVVLGGSQGAAVFSKVIPFALGLFPKQFRKRFNVVQQCREEFITETYKSYSSSGVRVILKPFFDNIPDLFSNSHLFIVRSGSSTLNELAFSGRPAIYIPYPSSADDHQTLNAVSLSDSGGGWHISQDNTTHKSLHELILKVLSDPSCLSDAASSAKSFSYANASETLADIVEGLASGRSLDAISNEGVS